MRALRGNITGLAIPTYVVDTPSGKVPLVPNHVLGTDGFGRSDYRRMLRAFFEVDLHYVALAALKALADEGKVAPAVVAQALRKFEIDPEKPEPTRV